MKRSIAELAINIARDAEAVHPQGMAALGAPQLTLEHRLHESGELATRVMDSSEDCIKILDLDGALHFMNAVGQRKMDIADFDAIRGCPWTGFWTGPHHAEAQAALAAARAGRTAHFQGHAKTMAGVNKLWEVLLSPILDPDGRPKRILSVSRDVTAMKRGEDAVLLNALILKSSPDCIVVLDLDGVILLVSAGGIESMEIVDVEAILGQSWLLGWPEPVQRAAAVAAVAQARAGGVARFEAFRPTYKNTPKWWDVIISALPGPDGAPMRLVSIGRDITARKCAERRAADTAERLRSALSASETIGTFDWDLTTHLVYADANLARLYGIEPGLAALGLPSDVFIDKIHPEDRTVFEASVARMLAEGTDYESIFRVQHQPGAIRWVQANGRPIRHVGGQPTRIAGANVDITAQKHDSERLREAELRMRLAQEAAGIGTFEILVETDQFVGSDQFFRLYGLAPCALAPTSLFIDLILSQDRDKVSTQAMRLAGVTMAPTEYRIRRADTGELRWIERQSDFQPGAPGGPSRLVGVARDVTDRKTSALRQVALVELGDILRGLHSIAEIADAAAAIIGHTLHVARAGFGRVEADGRVVRVERDWCAAPSIASIAGIHKLDRYGRLIDDLIRGDFVRVRDIGADMRTQSNAGRLRALQIEALLNVPLLEQGRLAAVWFAHDTVARSWTDQEVAFLQTVADRVWAAMAQVRAAADLRHLNETLETQVAQRTRERDQAWKYSQDLQVVMAQDGRFRAANTAWTTILGWQPEDVVGASHLTFVHPEDFLASLDALATAATRPLPPFENRYRDRDGAYHWISWVAAMENGLIYASGRHVTAQKQAALALQAVEDQLRQAQKMEAVGQLTGGLAHDFNNLLTGISGSLELLQIRLAEGRFADIDPYIAAAHDGAKRAAALTHRLLAFSRQQTLEPKPTNINLLVAGMQGLLAVTVGSAVIIEVAADAALWTTLVDPNQLENVLLNLVLNARDSMPDGGRVTIQTGNHAIDDATAASYRLKPGQYIGLSVTDSGSGMTPEIMARVFDPFYTTKPIGQGTGLGLSMIYGFAEQSGGGVQIRSAPGEGTTMSLYLPRDSRPEPAAAQPATGREAAPDARPKTILVVDDEPNIRMLVLDVLRNRGYLALEAPEAASALEFLRSDVAIDLLVTDVGLPGGMNGRQLAEIAREIRAGLKVLFITGYAENAMGADQQMPSGMEILAKPFRLQELVGRIANLFGKEAAPAAKPKRSPGPRVTV